MLIENVFATWQTRVPQLERHLHFEVGFLSALVGDLRSQTWDMSAAKNDTHFSLLCFTQPFGKIT